MTTMEWTRRTDRDKRVVNGGDMNTKSGVLKAFRCRVAGFDTETIVHAKTASKARYLVLLDVGDVNDSLEFRHISARRAPELDMRFPSLPSAVSDLTPDDKDIILHAFGGGSHIKPERWGYRNHYCTDPKDARLLKLVELGLFRGPCGVDAKGKTPGWVGAFFYLTDSGKSAAMALIGAREAA